MSINKASGAENMLTHYSYIAFFAEKSNDATTTTTGKNAKLRKLRKRRQNDNPASHRELLWTGKRKPFLAWRYCIRSICVNNIGDTAILPKIDCTP